MVNVLRVTCRCFKGAGSSRGRRAAPWLHSRRARSLRTAARWRTTKPQARSGGGAGPSPPPPRPAGLSHSAAHWAAYTEAHQSTHTLQSGQERTHTHANAQKDNMSSYIVKARTSETTGQRAEQQKADLDLIQSTVITADYTRTASGHAHVTSGTPSRRQAATKFSTLSRHFARLSLGCEPHTHTHTRVILHHSRKLQLYFYTLFAVSHSTSSGSF